MDYETYQSLSSNDRTLYAINIIKRYLGHESGYMPTDLVFQILELVVLIKEWKEVWKLSRTAFEKPHDNFYSWIQELIFLSLGK